MKIIIKQQITKNLFSKIIKVNQLVYIKNFFNKKNITNYNILIILIKVNLSIKINKPNNYNKVNLRDY